MTPDTLYLLVLVQHRCGSGALRRASRRPRMSVCREPVSWPSFRNARVVSFLQRCVEQPLQYRSDPSITSVSQYQSAGPLLRAQGRSRVAMTLCPARDKRGLIPKGISSNAKEK